MVAIVEAMAGLPFASVTLPGADRRGHRGRHAPGDRGRSSPMAKARPEPRPGRADRGTADPRPDTTHAANDGATRTTPEASRPGPWSIAVVVASAVVVSRPAGVARVSVLDVGQGDAILVEGSRGGRLLIDGGPDPGRLLVVLDQRIPPWDRRIDGVILSHPHEDHVAGLARLLDRYQVRRVFEPGMRGPGPGYAAWASRLTAPGSPMRLGLAAGDRLAVDDIDLRVLWPIRGRGAHRATGRRDGDQQRLGRPAWERWATTGSSWRAMSRRRSTRRSWRIACRASTCSRSPTTAAGRRRRRRSSMRSDRASRSRRRGRGTRTVTRRGRRSSG